MNKARVEAFTDAIIAIILTIMILEFKIPESNKLSAILPQVPYVLSYAVGYLFIGVAWYNHHYMFSKVHVITKEIFWTNMFWLFSTSFVPVATAWIGRDLMARGPAIFYSIVYWIWSLSYLFLSHKIIMSDEKRGYQDSANDVRRMKIYSRLTSWKISLLFVIAFVLALVFLPAALLAIVTYQIIFVGAAFNEDSDHLFEENNNEN